MDPWWTLPDVSGSRKSKMTSVIPEVLISQIVDNKATKFPRIVLVFGVSDLNGTIADTSQCILRHWVNSIWNFDAILSKTMCIQERYLGITTSGHIGWLH